MGYEYDGQVYAGARTHDGRPGCTDCHSPTASRHAFDIESNSALRANCHGDPDFRSYRWIRVEDYDGDGFVDTTLAVELANLAAGVCDQMQTVATATGFGILYDADSYRYFFNDANGNGVLDEEEAVRANAYSHGRRPC